MLKIGEFAQTTSLSVKALRHYDETGLLVPAETDPVSGYRLYAEEQVRDGAIIHQLRRAGVPLAQVRAALDGGDPVAVLRAAGAGDRAALPAAALCRADPPARI